MATPKFLRNRKTGAVFRYNPHLAKRNKNVEPYNGEGSEPFFEEVDATDQAGAQAGGADDVSSGASAGGDGGNDTPDEVMIGEAPLSEATKEQMEEFAKAAFGVDLDKRKAEKTLRAQVADLMSGQE